MRRTTTDYQMRAARCESLEELRECLRDEADERLRGRLYGVPRIDWTTLATFGGSEPTCTDGVWSWDAARLLVGDCANELRIVPRGEG